MASSATPLIGITLDFEEAGGYSKFPWYALRENYVSSLTRFGALAVPLPHEPESVAKYLEMLDGLVVTGGAFDVSPELYGQTILSDTVSLKERRTRFELAMVQGMLAADKPVLGICGGEQLLAVALGGTLVQHIPDRFADSTIPHEQPNPRDEVSHAVELVEDTLLRRLIGAPTAMVNSAHHQAVDAAGAMRVNAMAPDGVIEGVESAAHRFCLGVQWHPEFLITAADEAVMGGFVAACRA